jgi:hypothetical protein
MTVGIWNRYSRRVVQCGRIICWLLRRLWLQEAHLDRAGLEQLHEVRLGEARGNGLAVDGRDRVAAGHASLIREATRND